MRYIGIDAGGTKTEPLLSDEKGKQLRRALLPGVNAARMPVEQAAEALARGVAQLGGAADCLYAGTAGRERRSWPGCCGGKWKNDCRRSNE